MPIEFSDTNKIDFENSAFLYPDGTTSFSLVQKFHDKYDLHRPEKPEMLDEETYEFRVKFMEEELEEYREAYERGDLEGCFDALVDLKYVVDGTADLHGFPMNRGTGEVQRANMQKRRAESADESTRDTELDVVKPEGWEPPKMEAVLRESGCEHVSVEEYMGSVSGILFDRLEEDEAVDAIQEAVQELDAVAAFRSSLSPEQFIEQNELA